MFKTLREIYSELWQAVLSKQGNFPRQHLRESYLEANRGKREGGGGDIGGDCHAHAASQAAVMEVTRTNKLTAIETRTHSSRPSRRR
jgi:hypothetical protein